MQLELRADSVGVAAVETVHGKLLLLGEPDVPVALVLGPAQIVNALDSLEERADALQPVGQLHRNGVEVDSPALLKVGELRNLQSIEKHLPADTPGAQRRRLPVVL